jgi:TraG-like protein, N-terminal region
MFSNTAYEALYQILGLELHAKLIEVITGEAFFKGLLLMIFGAGFFMTALKFISRYVPGSLVERRHLPLSKFVKVVACLFLGLAILRVGTTSQVMDYQGKNWADNSYVQGHFQEVQGQYRVSVIFQLISHTAEELTSLLARVIDQVFSVGNSQLTAPNLFYKAIMYAGTTSIEDPELRDQLQFYSDECFSKVIPFVDQFKKQAAVDGMFKAGQKIDQELSNVVLDLGNGKQTNCLEIKESTVQKLNQYATEKTRGVSDQIPWGAAMAMSQGAKVEQADYKNYAVSSALVNYYSDQREGRLGIQKGSELPGGAGSFFQTMNRVFSWDGLLGLFGQRDAQGAAEAAKRSQEFSEHLARAPHVAGFVRMILVAIFPCLIFFVVAGHYRVLIVWFWIYFSVLLWTPLWTLLYHVMLGIALSSDVLSAFGNLKDGVSLYSASLVNHRLYYMYSIYSWVQLLVATLTTGSAFMFLKPMLSEGQQEAKPDFLEPVSCAAPGAATGSIGSAAAGAAGAIL